jgi:hypothetical protein
MMDFNLFRFNKKSDKAESLLSGRKVPERRTVKAKAGNDKISGATQPNGMLGLLIARTGILEGGPGQDKFVGKAAVPMTPLSSRKAH